MKKTFVSNKPKISIKYNGTGDLLIFLHGIGGNKDNWDLANSPTEKDRGSYLEENWAVLAGNNMINYVKDREEFLPGIKIFISNGHTTGMMHPIISDNSKTLFYAADIFPMASHLPLNWVMAYDIDPVKTINEKKYLLSKIIDEDWIVFFEHDPLMQAGKVKINGTQYSLKEPVVISE